MSEFLKGPPASPPNQSSTHALPTLAPFLPRQCTDETPSSLPLQTWQQGFAGRSKSTSEVLVSLHVDKDMHQHDTSRVKKKHEDCPKPIVIVVYCDENYSNLTSIKVVRQRVLQLLATSYTYNAKQFAADRIKS
jgi:hypothetical protein